MFVDKDIQLEEVGALYLSQKLDLFPNTTILDLGCIYICNYINIGNCIGDNGFNYICKSLKFFPELKELDIRGNNISYNGIKDFSENIHFITKLEKLDLQSNCISDEGVKLLSQFLPKFPKLKYLNVSDNKFSNEEKSLVIEYISYFFDESIYNNMIIYSIRKYK